MNTIFEVKLNINKDKDGYVFVYFVNNDGVISSKKEDGVFVSIKNQNLNTALHGDIVKVELLGQVKSEKTNEMEYQGRIVEIVKRSKYSYVGTLLKSDNPLFYKVKPSDRKIHVDFLINRDFLFDKNNKQANLGEKVAVIIDSWDKQDELPTAKIIKVLGEAGDNNTEMLAYAIEKGFDAEHYEEAIKESYLIKERGIQIQDYKNRMDYRNILTFTIDPSDAKDFDDAISYQDLGKRNIVLANGEVVEKSIFEFGIHIADVSFYIKPNMSLDKEAAERQTSVYLVDRVLPMLPEVLSNDLCSLVEGKDRLTMSAIFEMDLEGNIYKEKYGRAIINSNRRWTYEQAQQATESSYKKDVSVRDTMEQALVNCDILAKSLFKQRLDHGALIIETEEVKFKLDNNSHPIDVYIKYRQDIHKMIEELMLLANKKVSEFITFSQIKNIKSEEDNKKSICIYRIHDDPEEEKMSSLAIFIRSLGDQVKIVDGKIPTYVLNNLLLKYKGTREEYLLGKNISKSMAKAIYSTQRRGHYGLAFDYYTHFTSPIRRYPDVLAHRLLQNILDNNLPDEKYRNDLDKLCIHASQREKEAAEAERASIKHKQIEYMGDRIGKVFPGVISFISRGAVFVEDKKSKSEGLVRFRDLGEDYYEYDEKSGCVRGKYKGNIIRVGDEVDFRVKGVDFEEKVIEYILV